MGWLGSRAALGASATIASTRASSVLSSSTRSLPAGAERSCAAGCDPSTPRPCCRRGSDARPPSPRASRSLRRWCGYSGARRRPRTSVLWRACGLPRSPAVHRARAIPSSTDGARLPPGAAAPRIWRCGVHETGKKRLRRSHIRNTRQPHLLDQPVLQRLVGALDAALGLRGRPPNLHDAQPLRNAVERGEPVAALGILRVHAENPVPIGIERERQPVRHNVIPQRQPVGMRRLGGREPHRRESSGRVVDENDKRETRPAILEPGMMAAVDPHEFAEQRPALAELEHAPLATLLRTPQPEPDLKSAAPSRRKPRSSRARRASRPPASARNRRSAHARHFEPGDRLRRQPVVRRLATPARTSPPSPRARNAATSRLTCRTPIPSRSAARACVISPATTRRITAPRSRSRVLIPTMSLSTVPPPNQPLGRGHLNFAERGHLNLGVTLCPCPYGPPPRPTLSSPTGRTDITLSIEGEIL